MHDAIANQFSSSSASVASSSFSSVSSSVAAAHETEITSSTTLVSSSTIATSSEEPSPVPLTEAEIRAKAQLVVEEDLRVWQEKFAKAADQGSDELDERITEITDRMVESQAHGVGEALLIELEETVKSGLATLKSDIISIVEATKAEISDTELPESKLSTATRKAGSAIKDKAQAIRVWRQRYDQETNYLVSESAQDTFDIIDHIRDLGLQEVGMRWAWTDGITHKDWAKYHALKGQFDEWRSEIEQVAIAHPGLVKARVASEDIESRAMAIAEDSSKELLRIKETGRWKISTGDTSDDWSTKYMPASAVNAGQKILDKVNEASDAASEAIMGTSQGTMESASSVASSSIVEAASSASSYAASHVANAQKIASDASKGASSAASSLSSSILGTQQGSVESVVSVAKSSASSIADQASSSIIGTSQGTVESAASVVSASASSIAEKASSSIIGTQPGVVEQASLSIESVASVISSSVPESSKVAKSASSASSSISSEASSAASVASKSASSVISDASSAASTATESVKKVWGGAVAQKVETRNIILEDVIEDDSDSSYSEKIQSMASEAGDKFSDITRAVSEALLKPTSTTGSVESVTSLAAEQYSKALSAASVALYGTKTGSVESVASIASAKYADAVAA